MAAYEVLLLNTAVPQIQAAQSGDTYVVPRDIAFSAALTLSAGTANGVPYLNASKVLTTGSALTFDGTSFATTGQIISGGSYNFNTTAGRDILWGTGSYTYITGNPGTGVMAFGIANAEQMRLTSTGLGIGTSSPQAKLDVANGNVFITQDYEVQWKAGAVTRAAIRGTSGDNLSFYTRVGGVVTETMRLDASGNLGLGVVPSAWGAGYKAYQVAGQHFTGTTIQGLQTHNAYYDGTSWKYVVTAPANYLEITGGQYRWHNAPSGTAGDTISFTQAMTLDASGNLLVGTTSASTQITFVGGSGITYQRSTDNSFPGVFDYLKSRGSVASPTAVQNGDGLFLMRVAPYHGSAYTYLNSMTVDVDGTFTSGQNPPTRIAWYTNAANGSSTERARITSGGDLLVGIQTNNPAGTVAQIVNQWSGGAKWGASFDQTVSSATAYTHINFSTNGTTVGNINANNTSTTYATSSDYRLKNNQQPLTGSGAFIDALQPKTWNWAADGSKGVGFIAHEVQEVSPNSVVGEKDAVDADGKPIMQAMEYGSAEFIANIIAELQSLRARVAQLEGN